MSAKLYGTEKVGETFEYNGKTYKVVACGEYAVPECSGCVFYKNAIVGCHEMGCNSFERKDSTSVYYTEVE